MKRNTQKILAVWLILVQILCLMPQLPVMAETEAPKETTLVAGNSGWSYYDGNTDQGTAWSSEDFDDSAWKTGTAPLGYPATDSNSNFGAISGGTLVANAKNPNAYITYYFRKTFDVTDSSTITALKLTVGLDDGYVMYLNGQEVRRTFIDAGAVTWQTTANVVNEPSSAQGTDAADITATALPLLKNGANVLAVEMHNRDNNSSDIYFDLKLIADLASDVPETPDIPDPVPETYSFSNLTLQLGATEEVMNFSWISAADTNGAAVQVAKKTDMVGDAFPSSQATLSAGTQTAAADSKVANKATVSGLLPATEYVYRIGDGTDWSDSFTFETGDTQNYSFVAVGDPQIGSSGVDANTTGWVDTVTKALTRFPETDFILSAGDQVNTATNELEYAGFLSPEALKSVPIMPVAGNHDNSANYIQHFNLPNLSAEYGVTSAGGDYYHIYNDTLYIGLNSNNTSGTTHETFIRQAVDANPDVKWRIVTFHHSIYSSASHSQESSILDRRAALFPVLDACDIDMVFMGHDHCYTRSYQMLGDIPQLTQLTDAGGAVVNPTGTLYMTLNSASGSKYYSLVSTPEIYAAVRTQINTPTFSYITVAGDTLTLSSYRTDTMAQVDSYTIYKTTDYVSAIDIVNPYETVDWTSYGQYKADFHSHTVESDGGNQPVDMFEDHYAKGFDIMALTDHNFTNTTWDRTDRPDNRIYLTSARLAEINSGAGRDGRGMIGIPYSNEQSISDHVNTFWADFNNTSGATLESSIAKADELGGISHINHPGRYTGGSNTANSGVTGAAASSVPSTITKYVDLFNKYNSLVGMEIINKKDGDSYSDRILWDNILMQMMPGRPVWGFSNDDTHSVSATGFSYNMMLLPDSTLENIRNSMENGTFYAVAKVAKRELGSGFVSSGATPTITNIAVDEDADTITISGSNYDSIEWIADGQIIATGSTLSIPEKAEFIGNYVRAQLKGTGGISFTQPFGINDLLNSEPKLAVGALSSDGTDLVKDSGNSIQLNVTGKNEKGEVMDLSTAEILYKTDKDGLLSISNSGVISIGNAPANTTTVSVWATISLDDRTVTTSPIVLKIIVPVVVDGFTVLSTSIRTGGDDVEEYTSNGSMYLTSSDLEIIAESPTGSDDKAEQIIGLRFAELNIPQGAVIGNAYIQFSCDEPDKNADPFKVMIHAENTVNSMAFQAVDYNVSTRAKSTASVEWKDIPAWSVEHEADVNQRTPDLTTLVQEVVGKADWTAGNAMTFMLSGAGTRTAEAFEGAGASLDQSPTLVVTYKVVPDYSELYQPVQNALDDMEEWTLTGAVDWDSSDLEIGWEKPTLDPKKPQTIGIRFSGLNLPKGSEILEASIQFSCDETNENTDPFAITIRAENTANAAQFVNEVKSVTKRTLSTASVEWKDIPAWTVEHEADVNQRTPNLASLVQEVVNKTEWIEGNALSFVLTGTGKRVVESFEGAGANIDQRATLYVKFKAPDVVNAPPVINAVTPATGTEAGGTEVTLTGTGFTDATAVSFGSTPAASFTVVSETEIKAISPIGNGTVDLQVTTPIDTNTKSDAYTYVNTALTMSLTGAVKTKPGETYTLGFRVTGANNITAQHYRLLYDTTAFELKSVQPIYGLSVWGKKTIPGGVELILASDGSTNAITGNLNVLELVFDTKAFAATADFSLSLAVLSNAEGKASNAVLAMKTVQMIDKSTLTAKITEVEAALTVAVEGTDIGQYPTGAKNRLQIKLDAAKMTRDDESATQSAIDEAMLALTDALDVFSKLIITSSTGNFNGDKKIDVADLGLAATFYGSRVGDSVWTNAARFDIDGDGTIGIYEMAFVVLKMLGQ